MKLAFSRRILVALSAAVALVGLCHAEPRPNVPSAAMHDIVLVLDNSHSMLLNDRNFATKKAATQFIQNAGASTNIGVIIFDDAIRAAVHLGPATTTGVESLVSGIEQMNYQGQLTNIPLALTEAVQELKTHAREQADRSIVLLTDGVVATGDRKRNREGRAKLIQELIPDAANNKIRMYTIALGQKSDMDLLQSLANRTHGTYFWAAGGGDVTNFFEQIHANVAANDTPATSEIAAPGAHEIKADTKTASSDTLPPVPFDEPASEQTATPNVNQQVSAIDTQTPAAIETTATDKISRRHARLRKQLNKSDIPPIVGDTEATTGTEEAAHPWWFNALGIVIAVLMVTLVSLMIRARRNPLATANDVLGSGLGTKKTPLAPQAVLYDLTGVTGCQRHEIDSSTTIIGRVPPAPNEHIGCIVIDRQTIGRRHAVIERKHYGFWLIDQHSKNGTYVNDERISGEICLSHGDRIRFHEYDFEFNLAGMGLADDTVPISDFIAQNIRKVGNSN